MDTNDHLACAPTSAFSLAEAFASALRSSSTVGLFTANVKTREASRANIAPNTNPRIHSGVVGERVEKTEPVMTKPAIPLAKLPPRAFQE